MYTPVYDHSGKASLATDGKKVFPFVSTNRDGQKFLKWLTDQNKSLQEWLDENPYVPPEKTEEQVDRENREVLRIQLKSKYLRDGDLTSADIKQAVIKFIIGA